MWPHLCVRGQSVQAPSWMASGQLSLWGTSKNLERLQEAQIWALGPKDNSLVVTWRCPPGLVYRFLRAGKGSSATCLVIGGFVKNTG